MGTEGLVGLCCVETNDICRVFKARLNPGSVPGRAGWGLGKPGLVGGVPAHGRGLEGMSFEVPPDPFHDSVT